MFQALTQGMPLYILYKNEPRVDEARIISVNTHPQQATPTNPMAILNGPVTDIVVSVDGKTLPPFQGLQPSAMIATFSSEGMVISEDKTLIDNEIKSLEESHQRIVDGYESSKEMVEKCKALRLKINPDKQKEAAHAQEIARLQGEISEMKEMLMRALGTKIKEE